MEWLRFSPVDVLLASLSMRNFYLPIFIPGYSVVVEL